MQTNNILHVCMTLMMFYVFEYGCGIKFPRWNNKNESESESGRVNAAMPFQCAAPLRWLAADGRPVEMDSLPTARARQLRDIYNDLTALDVDLETRRRVLETLKHTVQVPHSHRGHTLKAIRTEELSQPSL